MDAKLNLLTENPLCHAPSPRMTFQWNCVTELPGVTSVLNVGSCDDPLHFGRLAHHFDLDDWSDHFSARGEEFTQGDAHRLTDYFDDSSFDLVLLGDVLEHVPSPTKVLYEASRVSSRYVAASIWEEWRLPEEGLNMEAGNRMVEEEALKEGYENFEQMYQTQKGVKVAIGPSHLPHIWKFTDQHVEALVGEMEDYGMSCIYFVKAPEVVHEGHQYWNWLVVMEWVGHEL